MGLKILIIDNYDSFTYNLAQLVYRETLVEPIVIRNDELSYERILKLPVDAIIISAGPGRPENPTDLGVARDVILKADKPILGICLGMQAIVYFHGGSIEYAPEQMHGRCSAINHNGKNLFINIPQHFSAMRYHSLVVAGAIPKEFMQTAWTDDNIIMAVQHKSKPLWGIQFHPESISTAYGDKIIQNFLKSVSPQKKNNTHNASIKSHSSQPSQRKLHLTKYPHWIDPAKVFETLFSNAEACFWLDSNSAEHDLSNISYMGDGTSPQSYIVKYCSSTEKLLIDDTPTSPQHILDFLQDKLERYKNTSDTDVHFSFSGGFVGWLGYECDPIPNTNSSSGHQSDYPDAAFIFVDRFLIFDHQAKDIYVASIHIVDATDIGSWIEKTSAALDILQATPDLPKSAVNHSSDYPTLTFKLAKNRQDYIGDIARAKEKIRQGESYELCLTNSLSTQISRSGFDVYKILRKENPAPFSSYLKISGIEVVSSSPERFIAVNKERIVSSKPIKGTITRNQKPQIDARNKQFLKTNIKDCAENLMIVDLLRNDLSRVCQNGSVNVPRLLDIESFATVHQLVSTIEGLLQDDKTNIDCIKSCFPGGSMTGAPKIRSMDILAELETQARGIYSGALGYFSLNGCCDLSIVIRTIIVQNNKASIGCGGAIVSLSDADQEYTEILLKAKSLIEAIVIAEKGELKPQHYKIIE